MNCTASIIGRRTCREAHNTGPTVHDSGTERLFALGAQPGPSRPNLPRRTAGRHAQLAFRLYRPIQHPACA